ncbi:ABC transporter ATP-binding protein [Sinosporangium siamense]|uniref:Nitrate ABC transporter ATP-binding protein n=1 Tax=Sinosporangium siamense TaxID=1367973 RepID=A0A919RNW4_9ACTN|nr:ABC transporter ATP-binding protein [Sinosporangium siamense]GII97028.1 nitrate ABC transporter ATP-binding protein [Sinosporangium siamense]
MAEPAIDVRGVWKGFHDARRDQTVIAIENFSFSAAPGEFICVLGPSGCGKSTLLRILADLDTQDLGEVRVNGHASVVFQEHGVFPWLSVEDNVGYPLKVRGVGRAERRRRVAPLLDLIGLTDFKGAYPHQLSGGMRQRTSVARALADDGEVLLMDEPFGALDEQTRLVLQQELLRIWQDSGKTVVFITHSVDEALTLADRVLVMSARPGRLLADVAVPFGRPRDILELRRDPRYGEVTYELWRLLRADAATSASPEEVAP